MYALFVAFLVLLLAVDCYRASSHPLRREKDQLLFLPLVGPMLTLTKDYLIKPLNIKDTNIIYLN